MTEKDYTQQARQAALEHGADLVGVVKVDDLPEHRERIERMLPNARSVLVIASGHSLASLRSGANELAQFDTIHAYNESARACHAAARILESRGFLSAGVPAFIPLDMEEPGKGMRGEICWRRAGVRAGLGSYGESGALVTREYGQAVRLAGMVTTADLAADAPRSKKTFAIIVCAAWRPARSAPCPATGKSTKSFAGIGFSDSASGIFKK